MNVSMVVFGGMLFLVGLGGHLVRVGDAALILAVVGLLVFVIEAWRAAQPEYRLPYHADYVSGSDSGGDGGDD